MKPAPIPANEIDRQTSLDTMGLLSVERDPELDRITQFAERLFGTEIVAISLLDNDRQFFKSRVNLSVSETSRDISFCGHAIMNDAPMAVCDTHKDERFRDNPLVTDGPKIRSYLGVPISNQQGYKLGTLCVIDSNEREFSKDEIKTLQDLAHWVETVVALRYSERSQKRLVTDLDAAQREALIDTLTGIWNRRGLEELLSREISSAHIRNTPVGIFMLDIDHFKRVNDTHGHLIGDKVIRSISEIIASSLRDQDIIGRFGGEEFVCILPGLRLGSMIHLGEKLCDAIRQQAKTSDKNGDTIPVTVSVGTTWISPQTKTKYSSNQVLQIADDALYQAKEGGRDTVRYKPLDDDCILKRLDKP
ncbi:MAG: sensor domain-containing diguanylate cyclase [Rhodospirillales bacterium]|nr:sensor domain-containing diguanylate cyclase [Rhodospirillales bacterium]